MIKYVILLPKRVRQYGLLTVLYKIFVDSTIILGIDQYIPKDMRWNMAHQFHTAWKGSQKTMYDLSGYNDRIDSKSREVLTEFYEVGLDFTGKVFVDVGCGTRGVLPIIKAKERIGVDPTIKKAKKNLNVHDELGIVYFSEKAESFSMMDGEADVICCNNALNHFENIDLSLAEMYRVLKPGGMFLLEVFIEKKNIAHTFAFNECELNKMVTKYFTPIRIKYERLKVKVEIDENMDGHLPMRWGGIFKK